MDGVVSELVAVCKGTVAEVKVEVLRLQAGKTIRVQLETTATTKGVEAVAGLIKRRLAVKGREKVAIEVKVEVNHLNLKLSSSCVYRTQ